MSTSVLDSPPCPQLPASLVDHAEVAVGDRHASLAAEALVDIQRLAVKFLGVVQIAARLVDQAEVAVGDRLPFLIVVVASPLENPLAGVFGAGQIASHFQDASLVVPGFQIVGDSREDAIDGGQGLVHISAQIRHCGNLTIHFGGLYLCSHLELANPRPCGLKNTLQSGRVARLPGLLDGFGSARNASLLRQFGRIECTGQVGLEPPCFWALMWHIFAVTVRVSLWISVALQSGNAQRFPDRAKSFLRVCSVGRFTQASHIRPRHPRTPQADLSDQNSTPSPG